MGIWQEEENTYQWHTFFLLGLYHLNQSDGGMQSFSLKKGVMHQRIEDVQTNTHMKGNLEPTLSFCRASKMAVMTLTLGHRFLVSPTFYQNIQTAFLHICARVWLSHIFPIQTLPFLIQVVKRLRESVIQSQ